MTRVIHTGDTHLGYRQYHSPERRADFLRAFRQVIRDAIEEDVDAVVHAGDLFHDRRPALSDIHGTIAVLDELRAADIPFLAIVGNHERTRDEQWIDLFETLGLATRLGRNPTVVGAIAFYGLDYVPRSKRPDLEYEFEPHDTDYAALVAHGLFTPFNTDWNLESILETSPVGFDAVLLGDDHQPDTAEVDGTWVTYCGSTERVSAAEREARGYNVVEFDGSVSIRRRGLETRRFVTIDLELASGEGIDRVRERIREEDIQDAVVIVSITGDGDDIAVSRVEEFARDRGALIARASDHRESEKREVGDVQFTDPDQAVRQRLRDMGLSEAAIAVDETVRGGIADSNVRTRVKERVNELIEDDPEAFTTTAGGVIETSVEEDPDRVAGDDAPEDEATADDGEPPDSGDATAADSGESTGPPVETGTETSAERESDGPSDRKSEDAGDGQVSIGEYL